MNSIVDIGNYTTYYDVMQAIAQCRVGSVENAGVGQASLPIRDSLLPTFPLSGYYLTLLCRVTKYVPLHFAAGILHFYLQDPLNLQSGCYELIVSVNSGESRLQTPTWRLIQDDFTNSINYSRLVNISSSFSVNTDKGTGAVTALYQQSSNTVIISDIWFIPNDEMTYNTPIFTITNAAYRPSITQNIGCIAYDAVENNIITSHCAVLTNGNICRLAGRWNKFIFIAGSYTAT